MSCLQRKIDEAIRWIEGVTHLIMAVDAVDSVRFGFLDLRAAQRVGHVVIRRDAPGGKVCPHPADLFALLVADALDVVRYVLEDTLPTVSTCAPPDPVLSTIRTASILNSLVYVLLLSVICFLPRRIVHGAQELTDPLLLGLLLQGKSSSIGLRWGSVG